MTDLDLFLLGLMVLAGFLSVGFTLLTIWRMRTYIRAYRFDREKYVPLFGFIRLRLIVVIYLIGAVLMAGGAMFVFYLI